MDLKFGRITPTNVKFTDQVFYNAHVALLISINSALRLGFRDFDFGKWLRLMHRREHDIYLNGNIRLVAGLQSLLSLLLVGLAILCFFGKPFDNISG